MGFTHRGIEETQRAQRDGLLELNRHCKGDLLAISVVSVYATRARR